MNTVIITEWTILIVVTLISKLNIITNNIFILD